MANDNATRAAARQDKVFALRFSSLYPLYLKKVAAKGRTRTELDRVLGWLTGYDAAGLRRQCDGDRDLAAFFAHAPAFTAAADRITGTVCGVRVETVEHPLMRKIRQMDKLVDELAQGRPLEKILRD